MATYIVTLALVLYFILLYKSGIISRKMAAIFVAAVLILVAGLRFNVGADYHTYAKHYLQKDYLNYGFINPSKIGLNIVNFISQIIYDDYATWFFIMSLLTVGLNMLAIYKYSESDMWAFTIVLYIFIGGWTASFNIVKQSAAIAILIFGQKFLIEEKFTKWMLVCIVASMFHISALLMIPIYFLVKMKMSRKSVFLILLTCIIVYFSYDRLFDLIDLLKQGESVQSIESSVGKRQVNVLRVLVQISPILLLIVLRQYFSSDDKKMNIWANMSLLTAGLSVAAMNSVYLTRFVEYVSIYNIYFLPYLISKLKRESNRQIVTVVCIVLYCIFWLYDLSKGSATQTFHWIFER